MYRKRVKNGPAKDDSRISAIYLHLAKRELDMNSKLEGPNRSIAEYQALLKKSQARNIGHQDSGIQNGSLERVAIDQESRTRVFDRRKLPDARAIGLYRVDRYHSVEEDNGNRKEPA